MSETIIDNANTITKEINVDVYDKKTNVVNAKQYDKSTRYLLVNCYNQGVFLPIDNILQSAYVRLKKPDGRCVFNDCEITSSGQIKVELTEQMLLADGNAYLDLVIVSADTNNITENTGELTIDSGNIFATMPIRIDIVESVCNCWDIESSDEFNALNNLIIQAQKNYYDVMNACKISENNIESISNRMGGIFAPQGTIPFSELSSIQKSVGYVYHISDEFTSDSTFKCGEGVYFPAGTNVYYTVDGYWDYFVGETLEVSDDNNGNVSITLKFR